MHYKVNAVVYTYLFSYYIGTADEAVYLKHAGSHLVSKSYW